ncbi:hypothetical protein ACKWTF_003665 [Chironomus riparius]
MLKIVTVLVLIIFTQNCLSQGDGIETVLKLIDDHCKTTTKIVIFPIFTQLLDPFAKNIEDSLLRQIPTIIPDKDKSNMATKAVRVLLDPSSGNDLCIRFNKMMILKKMAGKKKTTYVKATNSDEE